MQEPHSDHLVVVKHILKYIARTCDCGLYYHRGKGEDSVLVGYSDNNLARDLDGGGGALLV
jgi:hypothetical protein